MTSLSRRHLSLLLSAPLCALLTLATATEAAAQIITAEDEQGQSPISGSFELKLGGFYPSQIDADLVAGGNDPAFSEFYGSNNMLYAELVVERYLFKRFGKLGLGGHVGLARRKGSVQAAEGEEAEAAEGDEVPGETNFRLIPLRGSIFYKYDYSAIHHNIPLVPFARVGLDYYLWRIADENGDTSETADGAVSKGGRTGWHASVGMQLLLDFVDPATAAAFDLGWGVNNSYLFAEYMISRVDSFGKAGLDFSDEQWLFGLAFEF